MIHFIDRYGTTHLYEYDVVGRLVADRTHLPAGIDPTVKRLETAYDSAGRPYLFTSSNSFFPGGTVLNEVQREFNGFGQIIKEYQSHNGAVNTATTPKVQYTYTRAKKT